MSDQQVKWDVVQFLADPDIILGLRDIQPVQAEFAENSGEIPQFDRLCRMPAGRVYPPAVLAVLPDEFLLQSSIIVGKGNKYSLFGRFFEAGGCLGAFYFKRGAPSARFWSWAVF